MRLTGIAAIMMGATSLAVAQAAVPPAPAMSPSAGASVDARIAAEMPSLMSLYRDLHAHPELSLQERATAAKLAALVKPLGFAVTEGVGGTGVVAVMKNGPGPVLLIRADMDGLPVVEKTGLAFASTVRATTRDGVESGVMHACGHDTHMAAWIGTARALAAMKAQWSGTLVMILQPAEEIGLGASAMIKDGLFTRFPRPTHIIAFHDSANLEAGRIGYTPGYTLANVDSVDLTVRGVGGHGAYPQTVRDPIVLASRIVTTLQTLVSREQEPQDPAVVTVGSFIAGTKHNIVPDEAVLLITVRSYSDATRQHLLDGIARIAKGEAIAAGMPEDRMPVMTIKDDYTPATFNTPDFADEMGTLFRSHFGAARVEKAQASMAGEDFSQYYRADKSIRSLIFWVGGVPAAKMAAANAGKLTLPSLHSGYWAPDAETVVGTGARALTVAALDILKKTP
ncbi:MAG TPA: amidohydrolase [Sphingobium sp.]